MQNRLIAYLFGGILSIIFLTYVYYGLTVFKPTSVDYSFPIAYSILSGQFFHIAPLNSFQYIYFPGASYAILSLFIFLHIPLNLFGVFSWIILVSACKKFGETFDLNQTLSWIFAATFSTTITVIRTINDQSIDKWLLVWFLLSVIILEKTKEKWWYAFLLGGTTGMLIGTKYSGPLFLACLVLVYWRKLWAYTKSLKLLAAIPLFSITGLFWYIRNLIVDGSPFYPSPLLWWKGYPHFDQQNWALWKIPFIYPQNIIPLINSWLSEYGIWAISVVFILWYVIKHRGTFNDKTKRLLFLALTTSLISLLLPITPAYKIELYHIISDMRYVYIPMTLSILITFMFADKMKQSTLVSFIALINAIPLFTFLPFLPKIYLLIIMIIVLTWNMLIKINN